ncbi:MAG: VCBS repeat-containing protein [Bacteroidetes bacterium]|nr:VCBS repeat-containing protein [Bacteroidota bacterium]
MSDRLLRRCSYFMVSLTFAFLLNACNTQTENTDNNGAETASSPRFQATSLLHDGKYDEAEIAFKKAIKADPNNILNYIDLALIYLNQDKFDDVEKQIKAGLKIQPQNTDLMQVLAASFIKQNNNVDAKKELEQLLAVDAKNLPAYYMLSQIAKDNADSNAQKYYLLKILEVNPSNIVARLQLAELLTTENKTDSSLFYFQSVKKIVPEFSELADSTYKKAIGFLQKNQPQNAVYYMQQFHKLMQVTRIYASDMTNMASLKLPEVNAEFNDSRFTQDNYKSMHVSLEDIKFTDVTQSLGLTLPGTVSTTHSVLAMADDDGTGNMYVYCSFAVSGSQSTHYLFKRDIGNFNEVTSSAGIDFKAQELDAVFADYDNDGYQDLFISTTAGIVVFKNDGDGKFTRIKKDIGLNNITDGDKILAADFDQDGDLDLYVGCAGINKFFRNNGDGTFTEQAKAMNLALPSGAKDMDFGDWDADGDLDIALVSTDGSLQLFNNDRHSKFSNYTDSLKLSQYKGNAVAFADYNNDGMPDLFLGGVKGGNSYLLKNTGNKGYVVDPASQVFTAALKNVNISAVTFIDFDNDGHEDILVAGTTSDGSKGVALFHNDTTKGFSNVSNLLPETATQGQHVGIADLNLDGDDDIFMTGPAGIYLLRNDGGSMSHYMQVQLTGLTYGNSKNNRLGIGAQVELKSGDLYQLKTIRRALTNFGVGVRDSFDAVRVIWPNGWPQYIGDPSRRQKFIEQEQLKGSCPYLFTWDGTKYTFLKDMMWRSVLGMPLAINGKDTTYAFSDPSKEYLLIPGEKLQPRNNKYSIKITEELWEAVYFDKAGLIAVDHPDSVDVFADERFVAPPFPGKNVYSVAEKHYPVKAVDGNNDDVLDKIKSYDFQYISNFGIGKFQGLAQDHDLVLDLGDKASNNNLYLFLRGWIFPSDASINTSMEQADKYRQHPPSLQVIDKNGKWKTVIPNIGFPMGKDKMVIVDMSGKFLTKNDHRIRIQTNMQIYWDEIFFSNGISKAPVKMHDLIMTDASLAYRGYSSTYTKGGSFGPLWCNYYSTVNGQKWRDLTGYYTRYGDVLPLLQQADDEYIIADGGDEISIEFDASKAPALPKGWKRDFLIYSEGWVKDGDLNTAYGQTVAPLPFHKMPSYPYTSKTAYPYDKHKAYMQQYNTRKVTTDNFINALKPQTQQAKTGK